MNPTRKPDFTPEEIFELKGVAFQRIIRRWIWQRLKIWLLWVGSGGGAALFITYADLFTRLSRMVRGFFTGG